MTKRVLSLICVSIWLALSASSQKVPRLQSQSDRDRLIGAWHLVRIDAAGPDGKPSAEPQPTGMLIYTRDGHVSVQLVYPGKNLSNEYVEQGYEGSFGSYSLDEARHLLTHHVQGSVTRERLAGKDLPRRYQFTSDGFLLIQSANPDEHWLVTWQKF